MIRQAKYGLAVEDWMRANEIDCAGIQCWTSIQQNYGCAACLTMSMLGERLIPCACEVDIAGVLSMYALVLASGNPGGHPGLEQQLCGGSRQMCLHTLQ